MPSVAQLSELDSELVARWCQPNFGIVVVHIPIRAPYSQELDRVGLIEQVAANLGHDQIPSRTVFFGCWSVLKYYTPEQSMAMNETTDFHQIDYTIWRLDSERDHWHAR